MTTSPPLFLIMEEVGPCGADDGSSHDKFFYTDEAGWLANIRLMLLSGREPLCYRLLPATFAVTHTLAETTI